MVYAIFWAQEQKITGAVNTNTGLTFFYIYDFAVIFRRQSCRKSHSREAVTLLLHGDVNFFKSLRNNINFYGILPAGIRFKM